MSSDHWGFFNLPPFFTAQPASTTLERQCSLWSSLLLDHATYHASERKGDPSICPVLRVYNANSDIFFNPSLNRRLHAHGARVMLETSITQYPNHVAKVSDDGDNFSVLVATNKGGLKELEQSLLSWILEMGQGTTTAALSKKGAVMTFDELSESQCLTYNQKTVTFLPRTSSEKVSVGDVGALNQENAIRVFLEALNNRPVSVMQPFKITLFNLDGSNKQPYQGVKFGGE
ncbi:ESCRT-II complex subunit VPS25 [Angomonas deanei]|uniref:ESCRT-II complex subunit, putative n=1 Tax=Angomonas deanei TaxID=59799 RepID=A0A7G2C2V2_9TRYP|nr:ESCRT-II complex subunit VPS25 [Angomonas deanei]CAD2214108.1 ESCRT-II complex subunit, putative [Angomonas deanei]|eukprot:EPY28668.1 ESCRT-II complex subunit VPS25 [Angomonas deanei]